MKKDKPFYKGLRFIGCKNSGIELMFKEGRLLIRTTWIAGLPRKKCFDDTYLDIPYAKKLSKALRKGLRRLEK